MAVGGAKRLAAGKVAQDKTKGKAFVDSLASAFDVAKKSPKVDTKKKALV